MSKKEIKNIAASVHDRLLQKSKSDKRPFNELLQYFAMDRFLYRWSRSRYSQFFIQKGALLLRLWGGDEARATKDIDMLANGTSNDLESMTEIVQHVIATEVEDDGLSFDPKSVTAEKKKAD